MKPTRNVLTVFMITLMVVFSTTSCENEDVQVIPEESEDQLETRLSDLLDKMHAKSDPSGDAAITKTYRALTPEEYEKFVTLKQEREISKKMEDSETGRKDAVEELQVTWDVRTLIDQKAVEKYGVHANKLNAEQFTAVIEILDASSDEKNSSTTSREMDCPLVGYPYFAPKTTVNAQWWFYWIRVKNDPGEWICDYEYGFYGHHQWVKGQNWWSRQCIDSFGGGLGFNWAFGDTHMIAGFNTHQFWVGGGGNLLMTAL